MLTLLRDNSIVVLPEPATNSNVYGAELEKVKQAVNFLERAIGWLESGMDAVSKGQTRLLNFTELGVGSYVDRFTRQMNSISPELPLIILLNECASYLNDSVSCIKNARQTLSNSGDATGDFRRAQQKLRDAQTSIATFLESTDIATFNIDGN